MEKKTCSCCEKEFLAAFFNEQTGDNCVFCFDDNGGVITKEKKEQKSFEVVEDKGCASGACTL